MKVPVRGRLCADDSLLAIEDQLRQRRKTVVKYSDEMSGCRSTDRQSSIQWLKRGEVLVGSTALNSSSLLCWHQAHRFAWR